MRLYDYWKTFKILLRLSKYIPQILKVKQDNYPNPNKGNNP